jgi:hypothetical protein
LKQNCPNDQIDFRIGCMQISNRASPGQAFDLYE